MATNVGVAIEKEVVRAATLVRGQWSTVEIPFDAAHPEIVVAVLHEHFGSASALSISLGLGYLEIANPELPPLAQADARRVLLRDADRYFPTDAPVAIALGRSAKLAFAADSADVRQLVKAFGRWAPVHAVVAAPYAIARALANRAIHSGTFDADAGTGERGVVIIEHDEPVAARRLPASTGTALPDDARTIGDKTLGTEPRFVTAIGALECIADDVDGMLLDAELERLMRGVRERRAWRSYGLLAVAAALLVFAASSSRTHTLLATQVAADSLERVAAPAVGVAARLAESQQEARLVAKTFGSSQDALRVLATLSKALPPTAVVQRIDWDGTEWRIDGSADQAAAIVPKLDALSTFSNVRMLTASTRFVGGGRTRESFSVAFRTKESVNAPR